MDVDAEAERRSESSSKAKDKGQETTRVIGVETGGRNDLPSLSNADWHGGRRLEMPIFTGDNPDGWIFQAKRYFNINHLTEEE